MQTAKSYLRDVVNAIVSTSEGMAVTMSWLFRRPITIQYPYAPSAPKERLGGPETLPERYRGFLEVDPNICTACLACERACPIECISIGVDKVVLPNDPEAKPVRVLQRFDIDIAKCMFCGLCSEPCPTGAIRHTQHFEAPVAHVEHLCLRFIQPDSPVVPYKVKKGEEPVSVPRGSVAKRLYVERPWDLPALALPAVPRSTTDQSTTA